MSNTLYQLTAKLHKLIQEKAKKHGLEVEIERNSEEFWYKILDDNGTITQRIGSVYLYEQIGKTPSFKRLCPAIQAPQIRKILLAFQEVLGENIDYSYETLVYNFKFSEDRTLIEKNLMERLVTDCPKTRADFLCRRWLDGLEPLFSVNPETVLTELLETLKNI
jgi:hypothetical protein